MASGSGARRAAQRGLAIATELRNPQEAEVAHTILGHVEFATGDYEASRRSAVALYESAHARDNLQHETWGIYTQARAAPTWVTSTPRFVASSVR